MRQVRRQLENRSRSNRLCRRSVHHRDVSCQKRKSSLKAVLFSNTLGISLRPRSQSSGRTASVTPQTFANWAAIRSWFLPFYIGPRSPIRRFQLRRSPCRPFTPSLIRHAQEMVRQFWSTVHEMNLHYCCSALRPAALLCSCWGAFPRLPPAERKVSF